MPADNTQVPVRAIATPAGSAVVYDGALRHTGLPNRDQKRERVLVLFTFARSASYIRHHAYDENFPALARIEQERWRRAFDKNYFASGR